MRTTKTSRPRRLRALLLVPLVSSLALVGLLASPALAGRYIDRAVSRLGQDPVYVDAGARKALPAASATALRDRVRRADTPVYVAVLPAAALREAGGSADRLARAIVSALRGGGTVAVSSGGHHGAGPGRRRDHHPRGQPGPSRRPGRYHDGLRRPRGRGRLGRRVLLADA